MNDEFFKHPNNHPDYTISPFWFWNDLITDDKTSEQLTMMRRINAKQPIIHARSGLLNKYLSEDWFARIQNAIDKAKEYGMKLWLYDEKNWPSGNCAWTITQDKNCREHYLQFEVKEIKSGESTTIDLQQKNYIDLTVFPSGSEHGENIPIKNRSEIRYTAHVDSELYLINVAVDDYEPYGKLCVDYLSKEAIRKFINSTHEKYAAHFRKEFGRTITGIFMDETRLFNPLPWTETFEEEFKKRKDYDIVPLLPLLIKEEPNSKYVRYDYYDVVSDLMGEAMYQQIYDWCERNGIRSIGHFLGEETMASQSRYNGDIMRQYRYLHVPGIDHLGNGIGSLDAKICSSAAHNYGKKVVSSESFGASGWDMTFEEMVKISNWLFQQGINQLIIHGFYYSIRDERKKDWPPSYFYQWKYWDNMPKYADMAARMSYMQRDGFNEADILVYYPIETFWNYFQPVFTNPVCYFKNGPKVQNERARFIDNQLQVLCSSLLNENLDFEFFNSDAADNFEVKNACIHNKLTGACYKIFILPLTEILPEKMILLLNQFIAQGGKVVSYCSHIDTTVGKRGEHFKDKRFVKLQKNKIVSARKIQDVIDICKNSVELPFEIIYGIDKVSRTQMSYPSKMHDPYIHTGENQYGIGVTRYIKNDKRILNFTNYDDKDEKIVVSVKSEGVPQIYIPETGTIEKPDCQKNGDGYEFTMTIPQNRTYFVVCGI